LIPLAIGLCVTCCSLIALPIDGCSLNPIRSFASAAVARYAIPVGFFFFFFWIVVEVCWSNEYKNSSTAGCDTVWNDHWVFWFGPFFGGALGAIVYDFIFHDGGSRGIGSLPLLCYDGNEVSHVRCCVAHSGENLMKQYINPRRVAA
jgi:hypothetical protein